MKRRLISLVLTALVLCTMAVFSFADYSSDWITTTTYAEIPLGISGIDSTEGLTISVTISTPAGTFDSPIGARAYAYYSTPVIEEWQYFGGVQVETWDETYVFHNFTITLPPYQPAPNSVVGVDISDIIPLLNNGIKWRYSIIQSGTEISGSYDEGYNAGYEAGDANGYQRGYNAGYEAGLAESGSSGSYAEGYEAGYNIGYTSGNSDGYERGYTNGYNQGKADADPQGSYAQGFADGKAQGQEDAQIAVGFLEGFFTSLTNFFTPFLSIGIGPLTIGGMLALMTISAIVIIVVKVVRG